MRFRLLLPVIAWAALITVGSGISNPPGQSANVWLSYVGHFVEFEVLGALAMRYVRGRFAAWPAAVAFLVAAGGSALFGIADEVHQAFVPGRDASVADWLVDVLGAISGVLLWMGFRHRR